MTTSEVSRSESQAIAQLESIKEMVAALDGDDRESAEQAIQEDPLSVEVREPWHTPGESGVKPTDFMILLCTGGPACRITGQLDHYGQPDNAIIEHQDWGTPWTEYFISNDADREALLTYCRCFYFGE